MADFEIAYKRTLGFEGEETNDHEDPGGRTRYGIAENFWPDWWSEDGRRPTLTDAPIFYRLNFWNKMRGDDIDDQLVANEIFDTGVNCGYSTWHFVQEAINCLSEYERLRGRATELEVDGRIGPITIKTINAFCTRDEWRDSLLGLLDYYQCKIYVRGNPKFRKGQIAKRIGGHHGVEESAK